MTDIKFDLYHQAQRQLSKVHGVLFDIVSEFAIADLTQSKLKKLAHRVDSADWQTTMG